MAAAENLGLGAGGMHGSLKFVEKMGDVARGRREGGAGAVDEMRGEAEFCSDIEAGALAGGSGAQQIGGGESFLVVAHGGVEDSFGGGAINLDGEQVGGGNGIAAAAAEFVEDGNAERTAFIGVRGASEFVEQDQGARLSRLDHFANTGHVGAETRQRMFDGLVVANVRKHVGKHREFGLAGGNGPAGLGHEGEGAHGFHGDSLTTGVWTGNEKGSLESVEVDSERNDVFALSAEEVVEQGVTGVLEMEAGLFVGGETRDNGVGFRGVPGARKDSVERGEGGGGEVDFSGVLAKSAGHVGEDPVGLSKLFVAEADEIVI